MVRNNLESWRLERGRHGISRAHLARQLEVSRSYITKLEQGKLEPRLTIAFKISDYFGCRIEDIFRRDLTKRG